MTAAVTSTPAVASDQRRPEHAAEDREPRPQAAVEEDDRERDRADEVGDRVVVEGDAARPVLAGEHADDEEDEEQRRPEARRDQAREDAEHDQRRADEDGGVDEVDAGQVRRSWRMRGAGAGMRTTMAFRAGTGKRQDRRAPVQVPNRRAQRRGRAARRRAPAIAARAAASAAGSSLRATRFEP